MGAINLNYPIKLENFTIKVNTVKQWLAICSVFALSAIFEFFVDFQNSDQITFGFRLEQNIFAKITYRAGREYNNILYRIRLYEPLKRHFVSRFKAICEDLLKYDSVRISKEWGAKDPRFTTSGILGHLRRNTFIDFCQRVLTVKLF